MLLIVLIVGFWSAIGRLFYGKEHTPTEEETLCDFMTNTMCCRRD